MSLVLLHGGGTTARFWDRLLPYLDRPAIAVDLPGRADRPADLATLSVDDEVESVVADVERAEIDDPLTLVAHSSGGLVVPGVVAALGTRVGAIVLNAALVPPEGGCGVECMKPRHARGPDRRGRGGDPRRPVDHPAGSARRPRRGPHLVWR